MPPIVPAVIHTDPPAAPRLSPPPSRPVDLIVPSLTIVPASMRITPPPVFPTLLFWPPPPASCGWTTLPNVLAVGASHRPPTPMWLPPVPLAGPVAPG